MAVTQERRKTLVSSFRTADNDTGSPEVQVALITEQINHLTIRAEHVAGPAQQ